jgi:hypothetical protein
MDNPEKLATMGTQDEEKQKQKPKHNTICVGHHYAQTNTNNVYKTWALLQTTVILGVAVFVMDNIMTNFIFYFCTIFFYQCNSWSCCFCNVMDNIMTIIF